MAEPAAGDLKTSVAALCKHSIQLAKDTDRVNGLIAWINDELPDAYVGIETWAEAVTEGEDPLALGWARHQGVWQLMIAPYSYDDRGSVSPCGDPHPLVDASQDTRIEAVQGLPELIAQLTKAVDARRKTLTIVKPLLDMIPAVYLAESKKATAPNDEVPF